MAYPLSTTQPEIGKGKLSGANYENTVIDRKGRIRKVKPPVPRKPFVTQTPPGFEPYRGEQSRIHLPSNNSLSSPGTRLENIFDNRQFVIGDNDLDRLVLAQRPWHDQKVIGGGRYGDRREPIWKERPNGGEDGGTAHDIENTHPKVLSNRKSPLDNHSRPNEGQRSIFSMENNNSRYMVNLAPNSRETTNVLARDMSYGRMTAVTPGCGPVRWNTDEIVVKDAVHGVDSYKEVLQKNANLNWKPQKVLKKSIKKIDNHSILNGQRRTFPVETERSDVYEIALNRLEAVLDTDDEDDDNNDSRNDDDNNDDDDGRPGCSQRSDSPDTLVERILENVDETGMIVDLDEETNSSNWRNRKSEMVKSGKNSFSDEILERLGHSDDHNSGVAQEVKPPRSKSSSKQSKTLESVSRNRTADLNNVRRSQDSNLTAESIGPATSESAIRLNSYLIKQQNAERNSQNNYSGITKSNISTDPTTSLPPLLVTRSLRVTGSSLPPPAQSPSSPGPLSLSGTQSGSKNPRSERERSPEEIFEEIMESIHDTEGDYEEPFFLKHPSSLLRKGGSLRRTNGLDTTWQPSSSSSGAMDFSVENDWLSFFYCNNIDPDQDPLRSGFSTPVDSGLYTGLFLNSSLSSSTWIETKPSGSCSLPRSSSSRSEPTGKGISEHFTTSVRSQQMVKPGGSEVLDNLKNLQTEQRSVESMSFGRGQSKVTLDSDPQMVRSVLQDNLETAKRSPTGFSTNKYQNMEESSSTPGKDQYSSAVGSGDSSTMFPQGGLVLDRPSEDATSALFAVLDNAFVNTNIDRNKRISETGKNPPLEEKLMSNPDATVTLNGCCSSLQEVIDPARDCNELFRCQHQGKTTDHTNGSKVMAEDKDRSESGDNHPLDSSNTSTETISEIQAERNIDEPEVSENDGPKDSANHRPEVSDNHGPEVSANHGQEVSANHRPEVSANHGPEVSENHELMFDTRSDLSGKSPFPATIAFIDDTDFPEITNTSGVVTLDTIVECDDDEGSEIDDEKQQLPVESSQNFCSAKQNNYHHPEERTMDNSVIEAEEKEEGKEGISEDDLKISHQGHNTSICCSNQNILHHHGKTRVDNPTEEKEEEGNSEDDLEGPSGQGHSDQGHSDQGHSDQGHSDLVHPLPKRTVQVLSDEVTSQTVVLKIAWPSGKRTGSHRDHHKEQPFRELQLRRTIRMTEPPSVQSSVTQALQDKENPDDDDLVSSKSVLVPSNRTLNDLMKSVSTRPDVVVEFENQEQSRSEEPMDADTSVEVTQTDSVKVLQVPTDTAYQVPDLREIVRSVGQTILQDSNRIAPSANIRVTCEAIQSKSCAALKDQDITVINDTIFDTTTQRTLPVADEG